MIKPSSPAEQAFRKEVSRLPGNTAARELLQQLPKEELADLAHGLLTHTAVELRQRSVTGGLAALNDWYATAEAMAVRIKDLKIYHEYNHDQDQISKLEQKLAETPPEQAMTIRGIKATIKQFQRKWANVDPKPTWPPPVARPQQGSKPHARN